MIRISNWKPFQMQTTLSIELLDSIEIIFNKIFVQK